MSKDVVSPSIQTTTLLVGLSGPSSSGKTTLARLLRSIFNISGSAKTQNRSLSLFILHEDDFYKTDADIPLITTTSAEHGTRTLQDWDCVESLDLALLQATLSHVKQHGTLPADTASKEDQNAVGDSGVSEATIEKYHAEIEAWFSALPLLLPDSGALSGSVRICVLDGFLLYPPRTPAGGSDASVTLLAELHSIIHPLLDLKLFLLSSRAQTIARREKRTGYVTLEGFWADPPGYVAEVVWPNYVRDHAWMFKDGKVDGPDGEGGDVGEIDQEAMGKEGVLVAPGNGRAGMEALLGWGVGMLQERLEWMGRAMGEQR